MTSSKRGWRVLKFGGSSITQPHHWQLIASRCRAGLAEGERILVVVSALRGVTDDLTRLVTAATADRQQQLAAIITRHRQWMDALSLPPGPEFEQLLVDLEQRVRALPDQPHAKAQAEVVAFGERLSSRGGWQYLNQQRVAGDETVAWTDARSLLTAAESPAADNDPAYLQATPRVAVDKALGQRLLQQAHCHITQGFVAGGPDGSSLLLGRGGSDTSATALGAVLDAVEVEIWTDVPGLFSADPRLVPDARLLRRLDYAEAQEFAAMGAKILHPACLRFAREADIPVRIRDTGRQDDGGEPSGTLIGRRSGMDSPRFKGVASRSGITLITLEGEQMWRQVGFLADIFACFKRHALSVDLVATSESSVSLTLDPGSPTSLDDQRLRRLADDLAPLCRVRMRFDCVSISLIGTGIRRILGRLAGALNVFRDRQVMMLTQSANDLNLTLVVDADDAATLVRRLHRVLLSQRDPGAGDLGPTWSSLSGQTAPAPPAPWWLTRRQALLETFGDQSSRFFYATDEVRRRAEQLTALTAVDQVLYAVKANPHPALLRTLAAAGCGFECVSLAEVKHVLEILPDCAPDRLLFTPNFAALDEYVAALELGVRLTVDGLHPLQAWGEHLRGRELFLRLDLDYGRGHHQKVITAGRGSKFGIALDDLPQAEALLERHEISVTGLHTHSGSGILEAGAWAQQLDRFLPLLARFPEVRVLDLGGGLGVSDHPAEPGLDLAAVARSLETMQQDIPDIHLWLEPGRYLVAEAGVLLARVTQVKHKGDHRYVGVATGMNSLLRPALYGAYHHIVNLSRPHAPTAGMATVVGPICETGDVLGERRELPECREGDVMLIANCGAYAAAMGCHYNLRPPAEASVI